MINIDELSISTAKSIQTEINAIYKIQGIVHDIKLRQFSKAPKTLACIELTNGGDCILVRKWIAEQERNILDTIKNNSKIEVVGKIEYDSYLKENVMNAQKLNRI